MNNVLERVLIALGVVLLYIAGVYLYKYFNRIKYLRRKLNAELQLDIKPGIASILYFWGPNCVQCKTQELFLNEALTKLAATEREIELRKINAQKEPDIANRLGIMTIPAIVIFNQKGNIVSWNPGLMSTSELIKQLSLNQA